MIYKVTDSQGSPITRSVSSLDIGISGSFSGRSSFRMLITATQVQAEVHYDSTNNTVPSGLVEIRAGGGRGESDPFHGPVGTGGDSSTGDPGHLVTYKLNGKVEISGFQVELRAEIGGGDWVNGVPDGVGLTVKRYFWYIPANSHINATITAGDLGTATASGSLGEGEYSGQVLANPVIDNFGGGIIGQPAKVEINIACPGSGIPAQREATIDNVHCKAISGGGIAYVLAESVV